jgi:hypothetical protein
MVKPRNSRGQRQPKCKLTPPKSSPTAPEFSKTWMRPFLLNALDSADVESACSAVQVGMGTYLNARRTDPAFAMACVELDAVLKLAIASIATNMASKGNLRAVRMIADGEVDFGKSLASAIAPLPYRFQELCDSIRLKQLDAFVLAAVEAAYDLATSLQEQCQGRLKATDVLPLESRGKPACETCGALMVWFPLQRFDDFSDGEVAAAHDAGFSGDDGKRCATCGARSGLPWAPSCVPPQSVESRELCIKNMAYVKSVIKKQLGKVEQSA